MSNFYINTFLFAKDFYASATTKYKVHSPYLYNFIEEVFDHKKSYYIFSAIELLRRKLVKNTALINVKDFGAGSRIKRPAQRSIAEIAKTSLSPKGQCQDLFRMINKLQPTNVIELGCSLGISTLYMAAANSHSTIYSFEGNPASIQIAKEQAAQLRLNNIKFIEGSFDTTLKTQLDQLSSIDFAFIDGNHQYDATVNYFHLVRKKAGDNTVIIFDDIHWSKGMKQAWEEIRAHKSVKASLAVYDYGIIFFDPQFLEPKHINLIPSWLKPWQLLSL